MDKEETELIVIYVGENSPVHVEMAVISANDSSLEEWTDIVHWMEGQTYFSGQMDRQSSGGKDRHNPVDRWTDTVQCTDGQTQSSRQMDIHSPVDRLTDIVQWTDGRTQSSARMDRRSLVDR